MSQSSSDANALEVLDEILAARKHESGISDDSEFFEFFTAEHVLRSFQLEDSEIQRGLTGGGDDGQIDGAYLLVNGSLVEGDVTEEDLEHYKKDVSIDWVLIQVSTEKGFKETKMERIGKTLRDALNFSIDEAELKAIGYRFDVVDAIVRFRQTRRILSPTYPRFNVSVFYASRGATSTVHPKVRNGAKHLEQHVADALPANMACRVDFLGPRELVQLASQPPKTNRPLKYLQVLPAGQGNYICLVRLQAYYEFITENGEMLYHMFEANVRDYSPDAEVNREIRETLQAPPAEDFWCLNNGITVIVDNATVDEEITTSEPRIVNGLQTSEEIYLHFRNRPNSNDSRRVMVRVIKSQSAESEDRVIRATNRQTAITNDQLHATEEVHRDIERFLPSQNLYYNRRKNYRKYRDKPRKRVLGIKELAQAVLAIYQRRPDTARARPGQAFGKSKAQKELYNQLFPAGSRAHPIGMYAFCATLQKGVDDFLSSAGLEHRERTDLRYYVSMFAASLICARADPTAEDLADAHKAGNPISEDALREALTIAKGEYVRTKADENSAKGPELVTSLNQILSDRFATQRLLFTER